MNKLSNSIYLSALLLIGCASLKTGDDFVKINPGMSREQTISIMGKPDSFGIVNGMEVLQWVQRLTRDENFMDGFARGLNKLPDPRSKADYYVVLRGGFVAEKGVGNVSNNPIYNVNVINR